jgi:hypothetical protein
MIVTSDSSFNEKFMAVKGIVNDSHLQAVLKTLDCANEGKARLLLWTFMKLKMSSICYLLIKLKT